jgi:dynein heavy chain
MYVALFLSLSYSLVFQGIQGSAFVMSGQVKGMTLLPQPSGTEALETEEEVPRESKSTKAMVHRIESYVIEWTHQVRDVLKRDSADQLLADASLTPFVEIEFWKARAADLLYIFQQLNVPKMIKMRNLLEAHQSSYFPAFAALYSDVAAALKEADDINSNLSATRSVFEDFEQREFDEITDGFRAILHVLVLIWKRTEYYNTARHLVIILTETANQLITLV